LLGWSEPWNHLPRYGGDARDGRKSISFSPCTGDAGLVAFLFATRLVASACHAQLPDITTTQRPEPEVGDEGVQTMFPHFIEGRFLEFGPDEFHLSDSSAVLRRIFRPEQLSALLPEETGRVLTLYTGFQLTKTSEILVDVEETGGLGLSAALGIAGFPDLDAVPDPTLSDNSKAALRH